MLAGIYSSYSKVITATIEKLPSPTGETLNCLCAKAKLGVWGGFVCRMEVGSGGNASSASDMLHVFRSIKMSGVIFLCLVNLIHRDRRAAGAE